MAKWDRYQAQQPGSEPSDVLFARALLSALDALQKQIGEATASQSPVVKALTLTCPCGNTRLSITSGRDFLANDPIAFCPSCGKQLRRLQPAALSSSDSGHRQAEDGATASLVKDDE